MTLKATDPNRDPITVTLDDPVPTLFMFISVVFQMVASMALHSQPQLRFHGEIVIADPVPLHEQLEDEQDTMAGPLLFDPFDTFSLY